MRLSGGDFAPRSVFELMCDKLVCTSQNFDNLYFSTKAYGAEIKMTIWTRLRFLGNYLHVCVCVVVR